MVTFVAVHCSPETHNLLAAVFHSSSGIPCSRAVSAQVAPTPCPQFACEEDFPVVHSLDQSLCPVMISCVPRVRLMEIEKPFSLIAFTSSHLKGPVIASALSSCLAPCAPSHIFLSLFLSFFLFNCALTPR